LVPFSISPFPYFSLKPTLFSVFVELQEEKEAELSAMESQTAR